MRNKKGFTLIELLAIIVILAIIAVITVPIILNIIENSKVGAATDSAYGYKDAINKWYVSKLQEDSNYTLNGNYNIEDGKIDGIEIPLSGDKPTSGYLSYNNNVLTEGCLTIGDYTVTFEDGKVSNTQKGSCEETTLQSVYYTYDSEGNMSDISDSIDPSWDYWVRKTEGQPLKKVYALKMPDDQVEIINYFADRDVCQDALNTNYSLEQISDSDISCKEIKVDNAYDIRSGDIHHNYLFISEQDCENEISGWDNSEEYSCDVAKDMSFELCGIKDGKRFCLNPKNYNDSVKELGKVFNIESCSLVKNPEDYDIYSCNDSGIIYQVGSDGWAVISFGGGVSLSISKYDSWTIFNIDK